MEIKNSNEKNNEKNNENSNENSNENNNNEIENESTFNKLKSFFDTNNISYKLPLKL